MSHIAYGMLMLALAIKHCFFAVIAAAVNVADVFQGRTSSTPPRSRVQKIVPLGAHNVDDYYTHATWPAVDHLHSKYT